MFVSLVRRTQASLVVPALVSLALAGCWGGTRRPLFGGDEHKPPEPRPEHKAALEAQRRELETAQAKQDTSGAPARVEKKGEPDDARGLIARLDGAQGGERRAIVDRLVALGESARPAVQRALDETGFKADVLREVVSRLDALKRGTTPREAEPDPIASLGGKARRRVVDAPWVDEKYRLAVDRYLAGDYLGCEHAIEAILVLEPDAAQRPKLDRLRRRAREQIVAESVAQARVEPVSRVLTRTDRLTAKVVVENRSKNALDLRHSAAGGAPIGELACEYEELSPDGTRAKRRTSHAVRFDRDVRLASGEKLVLDIELPSPHREKPAKIVARYRLFGQLRPNTLISGEEPLPYFLRIQPVEVMAVDSEDLGLADEPARRFAEAIAERGEVTEAARRAFVAACLLARDDREAAIAACATALEKAEGPLALALGAALARATGEPGSFTKPEWLSWWHGRSARPGGGKPATDEPDDEGK